MGQITISPQPRITNETGEIKIANSIQWGDSQTWDLEISFDCDGEILPLTEELDPWLVLALLPAMKAGMDLELDRPISARLLKNLPTIQAIYDSWQVTSQKINVQAPIRTSALHSDVPASKKLTACFFSAGIDSFFTVLRHQAEIDLLIHLDNPWAGDVGRARMLGKIKEAAHRLGKPLIIVKSNFRGFLDTYTDWDFSHGPTLVSLAHLLSPRLSKVYIASSYTYANLLPNGTHPLLDPLWGTEDLEVVHDGSDSHRLVKTHTMVQNQIFLDTVRVCWYNIENELNCGRCAKCLVTMINFRIEGVLDRSPAFAVPLNLDYLTNFRFDVSHSTLGLLLEILEKRGDDPELETALRISLTASKAMFPVSTYPHIATPTSSGPDPELAALRQKAAYYDQALRFQLTENLYRLFSKNRAVQRVGEAVAHRLWRFLK